MVLATPSHIGRVDAELFRNVFAPTSVAVVGASDDQSKIGARPIRFLRETEWAGRLYPINPGRDTIQGMPAWPSLESLPEVPEHVFVATRTEQVAEVVRACAAMGVGAVTIVASGFAEGGAVGRELVAELLEATSGTKTRLIGPSSLGVINVHENLKLTANAAFAEQGVAAGRTFVASQSGSMIGAISSRGSARAIGFSALISTGNEIDVSLGEICASSLSDDRHSGYALFLESLTKAHDLQGFTTEAWKAGRPVLALKLGRSDVAAELALSHTGAIAGDDRVSSELLAELGVARVRVFESLWEGQALARRVTSPGSFAPLQRVGLVATTGGGGAMLIDQLALAGLDVQTPSAATIARLAGAGIDCGESRLIDLTLAGAKAETMSAALDIILAAPEFDVVIVAVGSSARYQPDASVRPIAARAAAETPIAAFIVPEAPEALRILDEAGVSAFRTPEACADVIAALNSRRTPRKAAVGAAPAATTRALHEQQSYDVFEQLGIPRAPSIVIEPGEDIPSIPFDGPYAVKVLSAEILHKSDVGGVALGVEAPDLRHAIRTITESAMSSAPLRNAPSCLIQPMLTGVAEALVGFRIDPFAGPVVMVGLGGIMAELHSDQSVRLAPVDRATAVEMIGEVTGLRGAAGYRRSRKGDLGALADVVVALSNAAIRPDLGVVEAEANPVVIGVDGQGVWAVDALVIQREG